MLLPHTLRRTASSSPSSLFLKVAAAPRRTWTSTSPLSSPGAATAARARVDVEDDPGVVDVGVMERIGMVRENAKVSVHELEVKAGGR
jgi:hypothetical protein